MKSSQHTGLYAVNLGGGMTIQGGLSLKIIQVSSTFLTLKE